MKTDTDRAFDYLAAQAGIPARRAKVFHALLIATMIDPANPTLPLCRRCDAPMLGRQKNAEILLRPVPYGCDAKSETLPSGEI